MTNLDTVHAMRFRIKYCTGTVQKYYRKVQIQYRIAFRPYKIQNTLRIVAEEDVIINTAAAGCTVLYFG